MAGKNRRDDNEEYERLRQALRAGTPDRLYAFWGEERYLLEDCVARLRALVPDGTAEFNHRRLDGRTLSMESLREAVDAFPAFSPLTLTEVTDLDFSKLGEDDRRELLEILSDIPDHATVVFIFDTVEFKLDGRIKANQELKKLMTSVEFCVQGEASLTRWIARHFGRYGKRITRDGAEKLIAMTGGYMTALHGEIEKLAAYCEGETVEARDVEAVVTPVLDAEVYNLTDAILAGKGDLAIEKLGELLRMNEAPHRLMFSISMKLRQLLAARILLDEGSGTGELMELCSIRYEFQARSIMAIARRVSLSTCRDLIRLCSDAAYKLNSSSGDNGEVLTEFVMRVILMMGERT